MGKKRASNLKQKDTFTLMSSPSSQPPAKVSPPALPDTLATRLQHLREVRGWTPRRLAESALLSETLIQDLESGLETFLAPAVRQKLARALRVRPSVLQEVERRPEISADTLRPIPHATALDLMEAIQADTTRKYFCPACGALLQVRTFTRRDLHDHEFEAYKVHCTKCLFRMESD